MENVQKRTLKMNIDLDNLDEMRRDVAPLMIPWWNWKRPASFPAIPDEWVPWPEVRRYPEEGILDRKCFYWAKYANREHDKPLVLGIHFSRDDIIAMLKHKTPPRIPYAHAVSLDRQGRVIDPVWGYLHQSTGIMVGRGFGIAPTIDLKTYCKNLGFKE